MGLLEPTIAIIASICLLIILIYKRVDLGIVLTLTALFLAFLALDWTKIPTVIYRTTSDQLTVSVVLATFTIMLLSQLYKETAVVNKLSDSIGKLINNPKIVLGVIPAIIGLLPVAGGALTSAPLVDYEAEKLKMKPPRKAYVNLWFRHTVFPVYPISQPLVVTAALTGIAMPLIILRQIPVVLVMIIVGYIIGFWKTKNVKNTEGIGPIVSKASCLAAFLASFSPIITAIILNLILDILIPNSQQSGFDVLIATIAGLMLLIVIARPNRQIFGKLFMNWSLYGITLAAYGAFLLRGIMVEAGISTIFKALLSNGSVSIIVLLTLIPGMLGLLTGSPLGGVSISISILAGILTFSPEIAALIYISAYLGYTIAPTHLCFTFTAQYFKCPLAKIYRYVIPSFIATFSMAIIAYLLL